MPRTGHDDIPIRVIKEGEYFNPRAPYGARHRKEVDGELPRHISIHVPRTGHDGEGLEEVVSDVLISIHVPRTGHDREDMIHEDVAYCISIHVPRTGHDAALKQAQVRAEISIHVPRTGHDLHCAGNLQSHRNFNPRAPYGARRCLSHAAQLIILISIHVPRTGHDRQRVHGV